MSAFFLVVFGMWVCGAALYGAALMGPRPEGLCLKALAAAVLLVLSAVCTVALACWAAATL